MLGPYSPVSCEKGEMIRWRHQACVDGACARFSMIVQEYRTRNAITLMLGLALSRSSV